MDATIEDIKNRATFQLNMQENSELSVPTKLRRHGTEVALFLLMLKLGKLRLIWL